MNDTQAFVLSYLKEHAGSATVVDVMRDCYLSKSAAYSNLEWLARQGLAGKAIRGKTKRGSAALYTYVERP